MKYKFIMTTMYGGESVHEFDGAPRLIGEFVNKADALDDIMLPWRIEDDRGHIVAQGKNGNTRMIRFLNGVYKIREGSIIEFMHGDPQAFQMRVDRFERGFVVLKDPSKSRGRRDDEGEIWNVPSHLESEWFVAF